MKRATQSTPIILYLTQMQATALSGGQDLSPARLDLPIDIRRSKRAQRKRKLTTWR